MDIPLADFTPKHPWLICIDSDGCAIDSMEVKHRECFGPVAANEWHITTGRDEFLKRWNDINLYSVTRGINRFKALAIIAEQFKLEGWQDLSDWTANAPVLSNDALASENNQNLKKVLQWSVDTNIAIEALPIPSAFPGVKRVLELVNGAADVAIVSSANRMAIKKEWQDAGLMDYVSILMSQDNGSKKTIIENLLAKGYAPGHVLMVGDAPGDMDAAYSNQVCFYPIIPGKEAGSWQALAEAQWDKFLAGNLDKSFEAQFKKELGM